MKFNTITAIVFLALLVTAIAPAGKATVEAFHRKGPSCSIRHIAGRWIFATGIGQLPAVGGDITALGTMNIDRHGKVKGTFANTIAEFNAFSDIKYSGSVVVNRDCTATLKFETETGILRTDKLGIVSRNEILAMSHDPENLWTYQIRRISPLLR